MYFDPAYFRFALPALLLSLYATVLTKSRFARYSQIEPSSGMTGADGARTPLDRQGLRDVAAEQTGEFLSGHYDPSSRVLRLSPEVYGTSSLSAAFLIYVAVAVRSLMTRSTISCAPACLAAAGTIESARAGSVQLFWSILALRLTFGLALPASPAKAFPIR